MMTAADTLDRARPLCEALVARAERQAGSRMLAYDAVARSIGVTSSWVRKILGRQVLVVEHHEYFNIVAAYGRLCERIEAEAERERERALALEDLAHAALASHPELVVGAASADRQGAAAR